MKIENAMRRNRTVVIGGVPVVFDGNGVAEVPDAAGAQLLTLGGYRTDNASAPAAANAREQKPEPDAGPGLESMNTAQLKKFAKDSGIDIGDATKKADLIAAIEKAQG